MTDTIDTTYGSCIDLEITYLDGEGAPIDIGSDSFTVRDAVPASLTEDLEFMVVDAAGGKIALHLDTVGAKKLGRGRVNKFRIVRTLPDGCEDNTGLIWVSVE